VNGDEVRTARSEPDPAASEASNTLESVRVLLVDDHSMFRRGVAAFLKQEGLMVVGEAANGETGSEPPRASPRTSSSWTSTCPV